MVILIWSQMCIRSLFKYGAAKTMKIAQMCTIRSLFNYDAAIFCNSHDDCSIQIVQLVGNEYSSRHSSADKYFNAISEIIGENQITCDVELLAQTLASKFSSKVYRFDTMYIVLQ